MRPDRILSWASLVLQLLISLLPLMIVTILAFTAALNVSIQRTSFRAKIGDDSFVWNSRQQRWILSSVEGSDPAQLGNSLDTLPARPCVWPEDDCAGQDDRIIDQLQLRVSKSEIVIKIFPAHAMGHHIQQTSDLGDTEEELSGQDEDLLDDGCPRKDDSRSCRITYNLERADVVIFPNADVIKVPQKRQRKDQIWIAYLLESPENTFPERFQRKHRGHHEFNWTASYRRDSDIVTPYAKFVRYLHSDNHPKGGHPKKTESIGKAYHKELIQNKKKKVAWFASNCHAANNRLEYAKKLSEYIQVDIYGKCGSLSCDKWNQTGCLEMLNRDYKFYLAFENSNSPEYITEKLFINALGDNNQNHLLLPIVMGPSRQDYERLAPPNSFIHVDDFGGSIEKLTAYLKLLDSNDALYYSYFSWKTMGRFVDTRFMCRVCLLAHETLQSGKTKTYPNLKGWFKSSKASINSQQ